jgi:hypothetical protein
VSRAVASRAAIAPAATTTAIAAAASPSPISGEPTWSAERETARFAAILRHWAGARIRLAPRKTGGFVGLAALNAVDADSGIADARPSDVEVGRCRPAASGQGYESEAALAMRGEAFDGSMRGGS